MRMAEIENAEAKRDRYSQCITNLDTAKYEAAQAADDELVSGIQRLMDEAEAKRDKCIDLISQNKGGDQAWVSPF